MYFFSSIVASHVGIASHGDLIGSGACSIDWTDCLGLNGGGHGAMAIFKYEFIPEADMHFNFYCID